MTARDDILLAAEKVFSTLGYEGASMRNIAEAAGVAQALLHYHFKNKEGLYEAVFERRSQATIGHRGKLLDDLLARNPQPELEEVLQVLFTSPDSGARTHKEREGLHRYVQMVGSVGVATDERSKLLVTKYFDPIAYRFIEVFMRIVPSLDRLTAVHCYLFAIGARLQVHTPNGRAARLAGVPPSAIDEPDPLLIAFTAAGIRAIAKKKAR
ncbi:MAG: TetR/AcrR family transcriptional regulator [Burkholderiaceae bacterium]